MTQISKRRPRSPRDAAKQAAPLDACLRPELFKALCDPTRVALLACLAKCGRPCSVSEVAECCAVDFSVVSRHLTLLESAGVVESEKKGRSVRYAVRYADISGALRALANAFEECCPAASCSSEPEDCCRNP